MEFFAEIFIELYIKLFNEFFPERTLSHRKQVMLGILCVLISVSIPSMLFAGIAVLVCVEGSVVGVILTCVGGVMLLAHVFIFALLKLTEEKESAWEGMLNENEPEPLIEEYTDRNDEYTIDE